MAGGTRYDDLARAITESYPQLPNRLQGIARFALGNPDAMALSTVAEHRARGRGPAVGRHPLRQCARLSGLHRSAARLSRAPGRALGHLPRAHRADAPHRRRPAATSCRSSSTARSTSSSGCASTSIRAGCRPPPASSSRRRPCICSRSGARFRSPAIWPTALRNSRSARSCSTRVGGMLRQQVGALGPDDVLLAASFRNYTAGSGRSGGPRARAWRRR